MTRRDNLVTITIPTAFSGIRGDQGNGFHRSTRLTPPINLIDTGHFSNDNLFGATPPNQIIVGEVSHTLMPNFRVIQKVRGEILRRVSLLTTNYTEIHTKNTDI